MLPLIIVAVPAAMVAALAVASCVLAGRRERFFEDPTLDEDEYRCVPRPAPASTGPAPIQARLATRPDHTKP